MPSPKSNGGGVMFTLNQTTEQNIISSFDQIEDARFEVADFKKNLFVLIDYFHELSQLIMEKNLDLELHYKNDFKESKIELVKSGFLAIESIIEGLALGLTKQLNETHT
jgi:hypothetical protein